MNGGQKPDLRRRYCGWREALSPQDVSAESNALCRRLASWPELSGSRVVLTYLAFRGEPDLAELFDLLPEIQWVVPRIEQDLIMLHPYDPGRLVRHRFGMLEPAVDLPTVAPSALDVALVPGVAFDRQGGRLGLGGGYYDRFLPATTALRVGVTYDRCLAETLPHDRHDQLMDWVATPTHILRCTSDGRLR